MAGGGGNCEADARDNETTIAQDLGLGEILLGWAVGGSPEGASQDMLGKLGQQSRWGQSYLRKNGPFPSL